MATPEAPFANMDQQIPMNCSLYLFVYSMLLLCRGKPKFLWGIIIIIWIIMKRISLEFELRWPFFNKIDHQHPPYWLIAFVPHMFHQTLLPMRRMHMRPKIQMKKTSYIRLTHWCPDKWSIVTDGVYGRILPENLLISWFKFHRILFLAI